MAGLANLPAELCDDVLSYLPFSSHLDCRLVAKTITLSSSATKLAFRQLRLAAAIEPTAFLSIAASKDLAAHVQHVELDIDLPLSHRGGRLLAPEPTDEPTVFLRALPQLQRFPNLQTLQVRFSKFCGNRGKYLRGPLEPEETNEFRYVVLDVILYCLAGQWTSPRQAELDAYLSGDAVATAVADANASDRDRTQHEMTTVFHNPTDDSELPTREPVALSALTVINLADSNDPRLTTSPAFQRILSLSSLHTLKLLVTFETSDATNTAYQRRDWGGHHADHRLVPVKPPAKYDFLASLPATWLQPSIATNLRTLMLYCGNYWGWCPKFDPRTINPSAGDGGLPNLRVLGLGNFVFSHAWQVEWIAGLGRGGGTPGLEQLFLDDCPIMWQGRIHGPLDESTTDLVPSDGSLPGDMAGVEEDGDDEDGGARNPLRISNKGYPRTDIITTSNDPNLVEYENPLRWHTVLASWRERMTALKVFGMGSGTFDSVSAAVGTTKNQPSNVEKKQQKAYTPNEVTSPSSSAAAEAAATDRTRLLGLERRSDSRCGMSVNREEVLQYIRYEGGFAVGPWVLRDFGQRMMRDEDNGLEEYEAIRRNDEVELEALITTTGGRD